MKITDQNTLQDYKKRLNTVFQYIDANLEAELSLQDVAEVAHFSPFHFHRIFKTLTGETLLEFISRRRIEKSVIALLHTDENISVIAHQFGYGDNASYTKAFKRIYSISPTEFRRQNENKYTKISASKSKIGQTIQTTETYLRIIDNLKIWIDMNAQIEVKALKEMNYAYIACLGSHELENAFQKLISWATSQGIMTAETKMMTIYHDSLKVTDESKARMSACIITETPINAEGEIGVSRISSGTCIVSRFAIPPEKFGESWAGLFLWMNEHGHKKAEGDPFEIYHSNFNEHPDNIAIVDFCIPVQ